MTEKKPPSEFKDINEEVSDEWESETTTYDRIRHVISYTYSPVSADTVAEQALTTPKTARKHLNNLAQEGFVTATTGKNGGTLYHRSKESLVVEQAADILSHVSTEELIARIDEMKTQLSEYQKKYDVESPEALTIDQTNQALSETGTEETEIDAETVRDWQTTRRNLAFANAALSIANAKRFVDGDKSSTDDGISV